MNNDLTFFTNEEGRTLKDRFIRILKKDTQYFDVLVGYFRLSGFHLLYPALENVEKVRILVGINLDRKSANLIMKNKNLNQDDEIINKFQNQLVIDVNENEDNSEISKGIIKFQEWLKSGKLEIKAYPNGTLHAKMYIIRKNEDSDYYGSLITGSSNFTYSGLQDNLEFNVELKSGADVNFALSKFEELWLEGIEISEEHIENVKAKTWVSSNISPYMIYLRMLYELYKNELNSYNNEKNYGFYFPKGFQKLQYQIDAVIESQIKLEKYNGVFLSDVVGLGKTYIAALLAQQLIGPKLIISPPVLVEYWKKVFEDFQVRDYYVTSLGKMSEEIEKVDYKYIFVDESHRYRNSITNSYQYLHEICYGRKVILISATPQNNKIQDIANQIYLFQSKNNSNIIPNFPNLGKYFDDLQKLEEKSRLNSNYEEIANQNAIQIREQVLRKVMIRRTRNEVREYYEEDLRKQNIQFPKVEAPIKVTYSYTEDLEYLFEETITLLREVKYARYKYLEYLDQDKSIFSNQINAQRNVSGFMKTMIMKRLESSVYSFKETLKRLISSHEKFVNMYKNGFVYLTNNLTLADYIDTEDELINEFDNNTIKAIPSNAFTPNLITDINNDLLIYNTILENWNSNISNSNDPKILKFLLELNRIRSISNKIIVFSESKDTVYYLSKFLKEKISDINIIEYNGSNSNDKYRQYVEDIFNPENQSDTIDILITTDVLSEGINLHGSNIIINFDLPWNPTKIMQRVGRINRVGSKHEKINIVNFFPSLNSQEVLSLEDSIVNKIQQFHDILGEDQKYLSSDEQISSHSLYKKINEFDDYIEEKIVSSNLGYVTELQRILKEDPKLFNRVIDIPLQSKVSVVKNKNNINTSSSVYTMINCDDEIKIYKSNIVSTTELTLNDFLKETGFINKNTKKSDLSTSFYDKLENNKKFFIKSITEQQTINKGIYKKDPRTLKLIKLLRVLEKFDELSDEELSNLKIIRTKVENGSFVSKHIGNLLKVMNQNLGAKKLYNNIMSLIPTQYLDENDEVLSKKIDVDEAYVICSIEIKE